jgi:hypothetical protein
MMSQTVVLLGTQPMIPDPDELFFDKEVQITTGRANMKKLHYTGRDCTGYLFAGDDVKYYGYTEQETCFLQIQSKNGQNEDNALGTDVKRLLEKAHVHSLMQFVQSTDSLSDTISIKSVPASDVVHNQAIAGTCCAHARATAI